MKFVFDPLDLFKVLFGDKWSIVLFDGYLLFANVGVVAVFNVASRLAPQHIELNGEVLDIVVRLFAAIGVVHERAEQRLAYIQARVAGIVVLFEKHHNVAWFGVGGFLEAQLLEVCHKPVALRPVGLGAVESRHSVHARLRIFPWRPGIILLPFLGEMHHVREVVVRVRAGL